VVPLNMHLMDSWKSPIPWNGTLRNPPSPGLDEERKGAVRSS
jgi:hypothetical protein